MTLAIYAGSFDIMSIGHLSVISEAAKIFGHVIVLVANNPNKQYVLTKEERISTVRDSISGLVNTSVAYTDGLVVDYARQVGANVLVRGMRDSSDCAYELALAKTNKALSGISTVVLPASLTDISSSMIREKFNNGEAFGVYCPPPVAALLATKLAARSSNT